MRLIFPTNLKKAESKMVYASVCSFSADPGKTSQSFMSLEYLLIARSAASPHNANAVSATPVPFYNVLGI